MKFISNFSDFKSNFYKILKFARIWEYLENGKCFKANGPNPPRPSCTGLFNPHRHAPHIRGLNDLKNIEKLFDVIMEAKFYVDFMDIRNVIESIISKI
jgi:hypothetical protein